MVEIEGIIELQKSFQKLEILPQKVVSKSVRKAILIPKSAAKKGGFLDQTGNLRKGIKIKAEKTRIKGKKVYQVTMDEKMNDVFVKMSKDGKKRYYYPASQEYGFKSGEAGYVPGFHFMRTALESTSDKVEKEMINTMIKEIDKI